MADTLDVITLAVARTALDVPASITTHDVEIARQVTAISRIIDDVCGPVVQRTVTGELHDGGHQAVRLHRYPVSAITTVKEARMGSVETLTASTFGATTGGYFAPTWRRDPTLLSGELIRRISGADARWYPGSSNVQVTYTAGRFANTAAVDPRFAVAVASILRRMWKREASAWAQSANVFETIDATPGSGFFRAVKPMVEELLFDDVQTHLVGFA